MAFLTNMSEQCKSTSPSTIQVKIWHSTLGAEKKLDTQANFKKGERTADTCCNNRLTPSSICTIHDNADRVKWSAKCLDSIKCIPSETESLCSKSTTILTEWTIPKFMDKSLTFYMRNEYIVQKCIWYKNVYIPFIQYIYTLQVHISTNSSHTLYRMRMSIP
jgi:hypothetical protein